MQACETMDYNVWLGNRIQEIMEAKKITVRGLAKEIDIGRMTLERILDGRYATSEELEKIAGGLGISTDRIRQKDTQPQLLELEQLLASGKNPWRACRLAEILVSMAVGRTELVDAYNNLGHALFDLGQFDEAHEAWRNSLRLVQKTSDSSRISRACHNLLSSYFKQGCFDELGQLLDEMEQTCGGYDREQLGRICHYRALMAYRAGDLLRAKKFFRECYEFYKEVNNSELIGRLQHDMADWEYHQGNYQESKRLLDKSKKSCKKVKMHAAIDVSTARTLVALGENRQAMEIVDSYLANMQDSLVKNPEIKGKFLLLKAVLCENPAAAQTILNLKPVSRELRCNAADFLTEYYMRNGDFPSAQRYYQLLKENLPVKITNFKRGQWF